MIPTRQQIQDKIDELRKANPDVDIYTAIPQWLDSIEMRDIIIAGESRDPKADIISDLGSYK